MAEKQDTTSDAIVINVTPRVRAHFRRRGVCSELHGPGEHDLAVVVVLSKERATAVLRDAREGRNSVKGSDSKALWHFVCQLEKRLDTSEHQLRGRIAELTHDAWQRASAFQKKLDENEIGSWLRRTPGGTFDRDSRSIREFGIVRGHRVPEDRRRATLEALSALDEIQTEWNFYRKASAVIVAADAAIEKARRR